MLRGRTTFSQPPLKYIYYPSETANLITNSFSVRLINTRITEISVSMQNYSHSLHVIYRYMSDFRYVCMNAINLQSKCTNMSNDFSCLKEGLFI